MAHSAGIAGKNARLLVEKRRKMHFITFAVVLAGIMLALLITLKLNYFFAGIGSILVLIPYILVINFILHKGNRTHGHLRKRMRDASRGAKGEEVVAELLSSLPEEYYVFHDLSKLAGDIDQIVVGPTGVYVIETKAHGGKVVVTDNQLLLNGHSTETDFIAQCWRNAFWVRDVLKNTIEVEVKVKPILVFVNAFVTAQKSLKGVRVINKKYLVDTILHNHEIDIPHEKIIEILRRKMGM